MAKTNYQSIDEYIATFSVDVQEKLEKIRQTIRKAAPEAKEVISYQMPTFRQNGILVHFGVHTHHIGFYPTPSAIKAFEDELESYESAKGSVKFPLDEPMPLDLVTDIVTFRVKETLEQSKKDNRHE